MESLTKEQRAENKARRLRNAADPNDGVTIRLKWNCTHGEAGQIVVINPAAAKELVLAGAAWYAE